MADAEPAKYAEYQTLEAAKARNYRAGLTEIQKQRARELCRERVRKLREKKKEESKSSTGKRNTRGSEQEAEMQRQKWTDTEPMLSTKKIKPKKRGILEKRRAKYYQKRRKVPYE